MSDLSFVCAWLVRLVFVGLMLVAPAGLATAADDAVPANPLVPETLPASEPEAPNALADQHALTAADLEVFFDGLLPYQIEVNDIAGATVSVVKDGKVLFAKGYGFADVAARKPVTADGTLFRIGSISKLFTWTLVMQLVEQGKLDLDADVNTYLDFTVPQTFGKPVTMRNLMTHRGGFEEVIKELGAQGTGKPDLTDYVKSRLPAQIFPPGSTPAYSNYSTALAGYIVERIAGAPFDQLAEERILSPLGMARTTFRQPLSPALDPLMSKGYMLASGEPVAFEMVNAYPAGSISASATDMARFMLAHLQDGTLDGAQILKPETAKLMHDSRTLTHPALNAMALGFYEETRNGHRIIGHGGDTNAFHSDLHLIPDLQLGFFVSYNSAGRGDTSPRSALWRKFLDRYVPYTQPAEAMPASAVDDATSLVGTYLPSRRGETSITKVAGVLGQATVTANVDGTIAVDSFIGIDGQPRRWTEIAPLVYRDPITRDLIAFEKGEGDKATLFVNAPVVSYERVGFFQSSGFLLPLFAGTLAIMIATLVLWPVAAIARWHYGTRLGWPASDALLRLAAFAVFALNIAFVIGFGMIVVPKLDAVWSLDRSLDASLHTVQYIGIAGAAGSLLVAFNALRAWTRSERGFFGKLRDTILAVAALGFAWFVWSMNLLDLGLQY